MNADHPTPQALFHLRYLCKLDHSRVARLCDLTEAQVRELEEGGHSQFASAHSKTQAARRVAATLRSVQAKAVRHAPAPAPPIPSTFTNSPAFFKLLWILLVLLFLLVAVAMPLLYTVPLPSPKLS